MVMLDQQNMCIRSMFEFLNFCYVERFNFYHISINECILTEIENTPGSNKTIAAIDSYNNLNNP